MAWPVPSLSLPGTQQDVRTLDKIESVRLFVERAQVIQPKFGLTEQNAGSVAQVCRRLSGMPLAIELAAARVRLLSVEEIANRLDDRFALLTSGSRTALARHQTLRATIDWSYDLLTQPEQVLFHRLAVFAGGFTLDGAEAVCGFGELDKSTILDLLGRLVGKSLVDVEPTSAASETRYRLLETIREYAREKLAGTDEGSLIQDRHLQFFLDLAEKSEPHSFGEQSVYWRSRIGMELDNIRAAIDWSAKKGESQLILRIAGALADYWFAIAPISEWNNYVETALQQPGGKERTIARAKGLYGLSLMTLVEASSQDWYEGLLEALDIAIKLKDQRLAGRSLLNLGYVTNMQGRYREARDWMERGLAFWQSIGGDTRMERGRILSFYGDVILNEGNIEQARSSYEEAVTLLRQVGDKNALAYPLRRLGQLGWQAGEYERASLQCKESLLLNYETEDSRGVIASIAGFAAIAVAKGELERGAQLMGAVEALLASSGVRVMPPDKEEYARNLSILQAGLDEKTLARFWARGKLMTYEEAVALALEGTS
jgi:non-specific serine/threonine protein kinase